MDFTSEQREKAKACATLDEFKEMAKAEGFDLSEEEAENLFRATRTGELSEADLDSVSGGSKRPDPKFNEGDIVYIFHGINWECKVKKRWWEKGTWKYESACITPKDYEGSTTIDPEASLKATSW